MGFPRVHEVRGAVGPPPVQVMVGDTVWEQQTGVRIGGPLSSFFADLVCSIDEHAFDRVWAGGLGRALGFEGTSRRRAVMIIRYVDDILLASWYLCEACLEDIPRHPRMWARYRY